MRSCRSVYEPGEDSAMLERYVRRYAKGNVLDMGTGSGIQAIAAAQNKNVSSVLAADVQKVAVEYCKKSIKNRKIKFLQSDLFRNIKGKFDTIIFNPPYLPQELKLKDLTIEGGRKGYETIEKFISEVNQFLSREGIVLMVFSSLTKKEKVEEFIKNNLLEFYELEKTHIFFEDIYVYLLKKANILRELENKKIKNIKYFTKGHRGLLYIGDCEIVDRKSRKAVIKKVAIKAKNPQSGAIGRIENEAKWLRILNKRGIGPNLLSADKECFVYEFIDGDFILERLKNSSKTQIQKIIRQIFKQLSVLDCLKVDKEEMHRPLKHIIISGNKPYMLDFERAHFSNKPKNITQFCQFITSGYMNQILGNKKIYIDKNKIIRLAKIYKINPNSINFKKILDMI